MFPANVGISGGPGEARLCIGEGCVLDGRAEAHVRRGRRLAGGMVRWDSGALPYLCRHDAKRMTSRGHRPQSSSPPRPRRSLHPGKLSGESLGASAWMKRQPQHHQGCIAAHSRLHLLSSPIPRPHCRPFIALYSPLSRLPVHVRPFSPLVARQGHPQHVGPCHRLLYLRTPLLHPCPQSLKTAVIPTTAPWPRPGTG